MLKAIPERRNDQNAINERLIHARNFLMLEENLNADKIIFLDEVGFSVSMRTKFGRAPIGSTPLLTFPAIRTKNLSVCCTMSRRKMIYKKNQPFCLQ
jgi:hypothetical protein